MADDPTSDGAAARKARNDAIRRARDRRNAGEPPDQQSDKPPDAGGSGPNYVEFIDRKMKEEQKKKP